MFIVAEQGRPGGPRMHVRTGALSTKKCCMVTKTSFPNIALYGTK